MLIGVDGSLPICAEGIAEPALTTGCEPGAASPIDLKFIISSLMRSMIRLPPGECSAST